MMLLAVPLLLRRGGEGPAPPEEACVEARYSGNVRAGVNVDEDGVYELILDIDPWNIASAEDCAVMCYHL